MINPLPLKYLIVLESLSIVSNSVCQYNQTSDCCFFPQGQQLFWDILIEPDTGGKEIHLTEILAVG